MIESAFTESDKTKLKIRMVRVLDEYGDKSDDIDCEKILSLLHRLERAEKVIESILVIPQIRKTVFMWPDNLDNGPRMALIRWRKSTGADK